VIGDPWTYIIDAKQTIRLKRAGRMLLSEVNAELVSLLKEKKVS
jgi:hypothetical protein